MFKVIIILVSLFSLFGIGRSWIAGMVFFFTYLGNLIPQNIANISGIILIACTLLFFIIHSYRLVVYFESSRKIQIIICGIDPFLRSLTVLLVMNSSSIKIPEALSSTSSILNSLIVITCINIIIIFYFRRQKVKDIFQIAEEKRKQESITKSTRN